MSEERRYILLPADGFVSDDMKLLGNESRRTGGHAKIAAAARKQMPPVVGISEIEIVDSVADNGPKVVTAPTETARSLRRARNQPYILAPIRTYRPAIRPFVTVRAKNLYANSKDRTSIKISVHDSANGVALAGVRIAVIFDVTSMKGIWRRTGQSGKITLTFPGTSKHVARLYSYPPNGYWGRYQENLTLSDGDRIELDPIDLRTPDFLQHVYTKRSRNQGKGVHVGIVDSGVERGHRDLKVAGGANVTDDDKPEGDFGPVTDHGTHVAGIIAGRGLRAKGMVGLAPEAEIYSYRVFEFGRKTTDTAYIMKAIYRAVRDHCDIINLSLGGGPADTTLSRAIGYAFEHGVICIAAAGNNWRKDVSYPAWYKRAMAVSALGKTGTFPDTSLDQSDVKEPYSTADKKLFIAGFSNIGYEIDFTGPGVAIISTVPNNNYAVLSGTSMACPAVTGVAAGLLSDNPKILKMERSLKRSLAIVDLLRNAAIAQGFRQMFEGLGLPHFSGAAND